MGTTFNVPLLQRAPCTAKRVLFPSFLILSHLIYGLWRVLRVKAYAISLKYILVEPLIVLLYDVPD